MDVDGDVEVEIGIVGLWEEAEKGKEGGRFVFRMGRVEWNTA